MDACERGRQVRRQLRAGFCVAILAMQLARNGFAAESVHDVELGAVVAAESTSTVNTRDARARLCSSRDERELVDTGAANAARCSVAACDERPWRRLALDASGESVDVARRAAREELQIADADAAAEVIAERSFQRSRQVSIRHVGWWSHLDSNQARVLFPDRLTARHGSEFFTVSRPK